ncbi:hypothetical protein L1987_14054 [Smallanthus sonchifolius]|uniref:Uncharacterized protein n=1 Tax=Smallanthus sonchifolius TaxID=185202 RepID=A0ACB9JKF9_9ASTR|nr:hypothetical protein L1987_14054 [Smallanthus sonchifolius]
MTARSGENNHSGHVVDETNYAGQSIEEANMQSNLHGDVPEPDDTTIPSTGCFFQGITHVQEQGNQKLAQIIYPDKWEDIGGEEGCIEEWEVIMNRNKECLDKENYQGIDELRKRMQTRWNREADDLETKFSNKNNMAIMGLEKWIGSHTNLCRMEKRKTRDQQGQQQVRFDMGHGECDINVCPFGRNKKVTKSKKDAQSMADGGERTNSKETLDEGGIRKHWRIWSSKNRKPKKNMPKSKYQFQQEFIPRKLTQDLILINEFNFGTGIGKEILEADKGKLRIFNNPRLRKIKEKEARLLEIAKSINATSENSKLINSIMGLTRSRLTRFLARMNEAGHVMIDENMIESGRETKQVDEDGFTLVQRRKGTSQGHSASQGSRKTNSTSTSLNIMRGNTDYRRHVQMQRNNHQTDMRNRNVTIGGKPMDIPDSSRANEHTNPTIAKPRNQEGNERQGIFSPSGTMGTDSAKGMQRNGHPNVTVTETSNRFMLLDEDGHELEGDMGIVRKDNREDIGLVDMNARWARKQERNLNISYSQTLNQDQRIEAKKACFSWASYVREEELDSDDTNAAINGQHCEEVDSESDATATFMKDDNFIQYQAPSEGVNIVEGVDQVQMDMDIVQAENIGLEINGA